MTELPARWVSIDPGDFHVGFATWNKRECASAIEVTPAKCETLLETLCEGRMIEVIVYEKFFLYGWNEKSLAGNEFLTCQLIGVNKYLGKRYGVHTVGQMAAIGKATYRKSWFKALTRREQMQLPYWGQGGHAKDAWAHGIAFIAERDRH